MSEKAALQSTLLRHVEQFITRLELVFDQGRFEHKYADPNMR